MPKVTYTSVQPLHMRDVDEGITVLPSRSTQEFQEGDTLFVDMKKNFEVNDDSINYSEYVASGKGLHSVASIGRDGRITLSFDFKQDVPDLPKDHAPDVAEFAVDKKELPEYPCLRIVIMIVGSRGDVQPYVALGKALQRDGHQIRIATHGTFRSFVTEHGLEFFDIGGDPQDLMSYMVKNPGLMPGFESLTNGDIKRKRKMLKEMIHGCWASCHSPCPRTGKDFIADAIISNPPAFAHIHCAEAMGIPLLLTFTMPWSPTSDFPHPLVNISSTNASFGLSNYLSYAVADLLTWQGVGDIINSFRTTQLGLAPLTLRAGAGLVDRIKVPWTYCMSPALVPKPDDWRNFIDVVGFYFLDLATNFTPPTDLAYFLSEGEPPVYIGFGSVVVEDAAALSRIIFDATSQAGVRALVSAGWGGLGGVSVPPHVFMLGNIPHDWLFDEGRVSAVVHHGGAGTTAIGLAKGRPTVVVPFFGDQGFWGDMIYKAGAGPKPIPHKDLNVINLTEAIKYAISPDAEEAARHLSKRIHAEDGVRSGVKSFYRHLPLLNMRCDLSPSRVAIWWSTEHYLRLSAFSAQTLANAGLLDMGSLDLHRSKEYDSKKKVSNPVSGGASAIFWTITDYYSGIAEIFSSPFRGIVNSTVAIPKGVMDIVFAIHEGLQNVPELYGSQVRKPGRVTNFKSGLKEGGKSLFYGYYDGISGLVREPLEGAKKDGFIGAVKGSARSFVNATMRPAAGILGLVAYPIQGAWKSVQSSSARSDESHIRTTRVAEGREAFRLGMSAERDQIISRFKQQIQETSIRQKKYHEDAERVMLEDMADRASAEVNPSEDNGTSSDPKSSTVPATIPVLSIRQSEEEEEDIRFAEQMELAKKLSLADHGTT